MRWKNLLGVAGVPALVAALVYLGTLPNGLVYDDPLAMEQGRKPLGELIGRRNGLTYLSIHLDHWLWSGWLPGFHLTNVILHAAASALVALATLALGGGSLVAMLCGLLFAVHPVHVEAVASLENRKEILVMIFAAVAVCLCRGRRRPQALYGAAVGVFLLALASKEVAAIGLVVMLPLAGLLKAPGDESWTARWRAACRRLLPLLIVGAVGTAWYAAESAQTRVAGPSGTYGEVLIASAASVPTVARLLVFPDRLSADYPKPTVGAVGARAVLGVVMVVGWVVTAIVLMRRAPMAAFAMAWTLVMYLPFTNVVPLTPFFVAERYLYVPSFGICLLAAHGLALLWNRRRWIAIGLVGLVVGAGAMRTAVRVPEWRDSMALWTSALRAFPEGSSKIHGETGHALVRANRDAEAIGHLERAIAIGPAEADFYSNLGLALWRTGRRAEALDVMERAVAEAPENQMIRFNLAYALLQAQQTSEAKAHFMLLARDEAWIDIDPSVRAALAAQGSTPAALRESIRRWLGAAAAGSTP